MIEEPTVSSNTAGSRAGSRFGRYQLMRLLGRGGFGEVYEAHDTEMDRVVALKLIATAYSQNQVFRQRLYREAHAAGRLHEPHVVPIHQYGEIDGQLYIDMRLIKGTDLQARLAGDGPLSPARAVAIVRQIAAALDAAHAEQVIHRDVKPANVLLTDDDFACLVDFGLANAVTDAKLTSSGTTIGTFAYMAPERLSNTEVDHRADIYALACVLYECLTGSPPYATGDLPALIAAHLTAPIPRPSQQRPQIPTGFDSVIARGMAKSPVDRYASAGKLARAAHRALTTPDQDRADTIVASTQATGLPSYDGRSAVPKNPPRRRGSPIGSQHLPSGLPFVHRHRRAAMTFTSAGVALIALVITVFAVGHGLSQQSTLPQPSEEPTSPSQSRPRPYGPQVQLPITGLKTPTDVAVDASGNVYVTDGDGLDEPGRVFKLPAGSNTPIELPFAGLGRPAVAVDSDGNVFITDSKVAANGRVLKLPAGSNTPIELPFTGLKGVNGVAVDSAGSVYVADGLNHRVLKLLAGATTQIELPFTGLNDPLGVAVDRVGNVYITEFDLDNDSSRRVLVLLAGSNTQVELPFTGLTSLSGVAVDTAGNIYITDDNAESDSGRVLKLPAGSTIQVELPFTGLHTAGGVAVDAADNVYVTDAYPTWSPQFNRVLKLPAG